MDNPPRRVRVSHEPVPGSPPWRAVIVEHGPAGDPRVVPVGRFDTHADAVRTGCTALRFVTAGIPWRAGS